MTDMQRFALSCALLWLALVLAVVVFILGSARERRSNALFIMAGISVFSAVALWKV